MIDRFTQSFGGIALTCTVEDGVVTGLAFGGGAAGGQHDSAALAFWEKVRGELEEYFAGQRRRFDLPVHCHGTDFQRLVWAALTEIPYGETRSYGQIARQIGRPGAARAVGRTCHLNPVVLLIPCHRVVGADGSLTGFGGGLEVKKRLLALEADHAKRGREKSL